MLNTCNKRHHALFVGLAQNKWRKKIIKKKQRHIPKKEKPLLSPSQFLSFAFLDEIKMPNEKRDYFFFLLFLSAFLLSFFLLFFSFFLSKCRTLALSLLKLNCRTPLKEIELPFYNLKVACTSPFVVYKPLWQTLACLSSWFSARSFYRKSRSARLKGKRWRVDPSITDIPSSF